MTSVRQLTMLTLASIASTATDAAPQGYFELSPNVTLESGDTWAEEGHRYRLFGVQSCLRGTFFTDLSGLRRDCGEASMAVLAAYIKDVHPSCAPVAIRKALTYVVCYASIAGQQLDLGTIMVAGGYAFAALDNAGLPENVAYFVAERAAQSGKRGLWAFADVRHPAILLGQAKSPIKATHP